MKAEEIVAAMMEKDYFSQWLGIEVLDLTPGACRLSMRVRREMLNGFGIAHGGITYSLADSALAFASNSQGLKSLSIETSVSHLLSLQEGDELLAEALCEAQTNKLGHYKVKVTRKGSANELVALFRGMVYKTGKAWGENL